MKKKITRRREQPKEEVISKGEKIQKIDFMNTEFLSRFVSERGKIYSRSRTGLSSKDQRKLTVAIKRARFLALLPYTVKPE
jgi:small subunit ribosomal protein S18